MWLTRLSLFIPAIILPVVLMAEILSPAQQVAPHSYAWIGPYGPPTAENQGFRMNLGFVVGEDAVAVIDSGYSDAMAREMLSQIQRITDSPVRYVINTNSQPHRILGNSVFRDQGAEIIAAQEAIPRIVGQGESMAETAEGILGVESDSIQPPEKPDIALEQARTIDLGSVKINIVPVGTAHTAGSLIVQVVNDKVVYAADVLYRGRLLAVLPVSRVDGWIDAFEKLRAYDDALFVPGHGEPGRLSAFEDPTYAYLVTLKEHMDEAVDAGTYMQDAIDSLDQSAWEHMADFESLAGRNAHRTYLEREAAAFE